MKHSATSALNLSNVRCGQPVRVRHLISEPGTSVRLREMGFCEDAEVCKLCEGSALICRVAGARVALSRALGAAIVVEAAQFTGL